MVCRIFVGVATLFILLVSALGCSFSCSKTTASAGESFFINNAVDDSTIYNLKLIREGGGFPKWSPANNLIVFTEPVNGTYEVFTMTPDGKNVTCLTCGKKDLENCGHRGQPYWHPSGEYIVFTAENKNYERKGFGVTSSPGVGRNHNIWIMSSDGNKFWQITDYPENWGAIKPVFSHDGTKVCWSEEYSMEKYPRGSFWGWLNLLLRPGEELGLWRIKVANISFEDNKPEIQDVKSIELPPELSLLECEGFTPDDNGFICSICDLTEHNGKAFWGDIYIIDFKGNVVKKLTHTLFQHDENAEYSPGGDKIVWSHPPGFYREGYPGKKTELYLMDANGGNKTRLTYFSDPNHPEYDRYGKHCTEITWSPDGKNIVFGHESRLLWRFTSFRDSDLYMLSLQPSTLVENVKLVKENGWRVDWSPNGDLIAFDKTREDGYYDVYVMNPDGTGEKCLTDKPDLPKGHKGCPAWHPSGEYIVFTCQKNQFFGCRIPVFKQWLDKFSVPGIGFNCDLWVMKKDGSRFWMLTNLSTKKSFFDKQPYTGVIHPHFSHSGKKLLWSERIAEGGKWGEWALKVADFVVEEEEPRLENIRMYQPGEQHLFYESHGFSPDDKKIIFSGNLKMGQDENYLDIYTLDLETEELTRLTHSMSEWDEHAQFSPSGDKIVWMSSTRYGMNTERNWWKYLKTDYWMMNTDGSGKTQITFFNQNLGDSKRIICSDCSWNPDGTKLAVTMLVCDGEEATGGGIAIIEFF